MATKKSTADNAASTSKTLTDAAIRALKPGQERADPATPGLRVLCRQNGAKVFVYRFRTPAPENMLTKMKIGQWATPTEAAEIEKEMAEGKAERRRAKILTLAEARTEVGVLKGVRREVGNPYAVRLEERRRAQEEAAAKEAEARETAYTVRTLIREYAEHISGKNRSWQQTQRQLEKYIQPTLGATPVADLTRRDVLAVLDKLALKTPVLANRVLAAARSMLTYAVERDHAPTNVLLRVRAPGGRERAKDRALDDDEIGTVLNGLAKTEMPEDLRVAFEIQLRLGARPSEVLEMPWSELDLRKREWALPSERSKNRRPLTLPLPQQVVELLLARPSRAGEDKSIYVFPSVRQSAPRRAGATAPRERGPRRVDVAGGELRKAMPTLEVPAFTLHDLRRTTSTGLARLKVPRETRDRILNHIDRSIDARHYNRHSYWDEAKDALELWSDHVDAVVAKAAKTAGASR